MKNLLIKALKKSQIDTVLHVGGHIGQEVNFYSSFNFTKVYFVEPVEKFAKEIILKTQYLKNFEVLNFALGSVNKFENIYIAKKGAEDDSGSTSILEPRESQIEFEDPIKIEIKKFSSLNIPRIDIAVIDTQGYELEVLKGFEHRLSEVKFFIVEFSNFEGYKKQVVYKDLNKYLNKNNFYLLAQQKKTISIFPSLQTGSYGDALYINAASLTNLSKIICKIRFIVMNNYFYDFINKFLNLKFYKNLIKK